jgi:hypothetical protein
MALQQEKSKLFIQEMKKVTGCDYALRFAGSSDFWTQLKDELCYEQKYGYGVYWDAYALDKGAWIIEESVFMALLESYFGRDALLQRMRIADVRYEGGIRV